VNKYIIINDKETSFFGKIKNFCTKFFKISVFLVIIVLVLYLAILTSLFLIALFLIIGAISMIMMKLKKKKNYYKID